MSQRSIEYCLKRKRSDSVETIFESINCPICLIPIHQLSLSQRQVHVDSCLHIEITEESIPIQQVPKVPTQSPIPMVKVPRAKPPTPKPKRSQPYPPYFKILSFTNLQLIVDGFNFQPIPHISHYFLSHFHSDHYIGLTKSWSKGIIHCSKTTANLMRHKFKIPNERIVEIELNSPYTITSELTVTLFDANHCPGGVIFLFEQYDKNNNIIKRTLHTGDFRVSSTHLSTFKDLYLDEIYLDTTYLNPIYSFPQLDKTVEISCNFINQVINTKLHTKNSILNYVNGNTNKQYIILIGTYSIGKEKLYVQLAKSLQTKIFISREKYKILSLIESIDLSWFSTLEKDCLIHIIPIGKLNDSKFLTKYSSRNLIRIKPTGWTFNSINRKNYTSSNDKSLILSQTLTSTSSSIDQSQMLQKYLETTFKSSNFLQIPYSEHSSFKELSIFATMIKFGKIVPTVNLNKTDEFNEWFKLWSDNYNKNPNIINQYFNDP